MGKITIPSFRNTHTPLRVKSEKIGKPNAHLQIRTAPDGRKYEWHSTKGFRRWITTNKFPEQAHGGNISRQ